MFNSAKFQFFFLSDLIWVVLAYISWACLVNQFLRVKSKLESKQSFSVSLGICNHGRVGELRIGLEAVIEASIRCQLALGDLQI